MINKKYPKKLFLFFIPITVFLALFSGCSGKKQSFLEYQKNPLTATATMTVNGSEYTVTVKKENNGNGSVLFHSPDELSDISFVKNEEGLCCYVGDVKVPFPSQNDNFSHIFSLFELSEDELVASSADLIGGVKVNIAEFVHGDKKVRLFLSADTDLPIRIESESQNLSITLNFSEFQIISTTDLNTDKNG